MYLAVLGRQPDISIAELTALFSHVKQITPSLATFTTDTPVYIDRLGGTLKLAIKLDQPPLAFLSNLPDGKITLGISDYSKGASKKSAELTALKFKKILVRHGRSVRILDHKDATLSTATSLHNGLSGKNPRKLELIKVNTEWYRVIGVQDIDAYAKRDQARPARDARVGMLPPKLAQILINLCGPLPPGARILDPFCGTGVVLQEALLMGFHAYGTDLSDKMVNYSKKNLEWLIEKTEKRSFEGGPEAGKPRCSASHPWQTAGGSERKTSSLVFPKQRRADDFSRRAGWTRSEKEPFSVSSGDAVSFTWTPPIDAVACEGYLGQPMSTAPSDIKLKTEKQTCNTIILGFLKNLSTQISSGTPVVIAVPAWLRPDGTYSRLKIVDNLDEMGYNVNNKSREGLLYCRKGQIVARDIIILRKK